MEDDKKELEHLRGLLKQLTRENNEYRIRLQRIRDWITLVQKDKSTMTFAEASFVALIDNFLLEDL